MLLLLTVGNYKKFDVGVAFSGTKLYTKFQEYLLVGSEIERDTHTAFGSHEPKFSRNQLK
jgi:hypothetical protein